jgi:hypothetical protein
MKFEKALQKKKKKDGIIRRTMPIVVKEDSSMGQSDVAYSALTAGLMNVSKDRSDYDYKKKKRSSKKDKSIIRSVKEDCDTDTPTADPLKNAKPDVVWGKDMKKRKKKVLKRVEEASYDSPVSAYSREDEISRGYKPGVRTDDEVRKQQKRLGKAAEDTRMKKTKVRLIKKVVEQMAPPAPGALATPPGTTRGGGMSAADVVGMPRDLGKDALKKKKKKIIIRKTSSKI